MAGNTPTRTFRCPDNLWNPAKKMANDLGITLTEVLIDALEEFVDR